MNGGHTPGIVDIGGFRLERQARRLTDPAGRPVPLTPKAFDTLAVLAGHAGELVDKRHIVEKVWPGVIVEENSLNQAVSQLRKALGDSREAPRFIATVPGRGYQLIAPVRAIQMSASVPAAAPDNAAPPPGRAPGRADPSRALPLLVGATAAFAVVAIAAFALRPAPPSRPFQEEKPEAAWAAADHGGAGLVFPESIPDTQDQQARDLYVRGRGLLHANGAANIARAEALFRLALDRDADFVAAERSLSEVLLHIALHFPDRRAVAFAESREIIARHAQQASNAADRHLLRAVVLDIRDNDYAGARRELLAALPIAAPAMRARIEASLADYGVMMGAMAAGVGTARARMLANPLSLPDSLELQRRLHASGDFGAAEAEYRRSHDLQGDRYFVETFATLRAAVAGLDRAVVAERAARAWAATPPAIRAGGFDAATVLDNREAALAGLRRELARYPDPGAMNPVGVAMWADYFGDVDLALAALDTSYRHYGVGMTRYPWDGEFRHLRRHPGFKELMRHYGYEEYWRATGEWGDFCRPLGSADFECR